MADLTRIGGVVRREVGDASAHRAVIRRVASPPTRSLAGRWGFLALLGGWVGLVSLRSVAVVIDDISSGGALVAFAGLVVGCLVVIGVGCRISVVAARSPSHHVFHSRPSFLTGSVLILGGAVILVSFARRSPFDRFAAYGHVTAETVVDIGVGVAALVCLTAGLFALLASWDARDDERAWCREPPEGS